MNTTPSQPGPGPANPPGDPRLPAGLARDLGVLFSAPVSIPPDLDAEVLAAAGQRLARSRRPTVLFRFAQVGGGLAAAAALVIAAVVIWPGGQPAPAPTTTGGLAIAKREASNESALLAQRPGLASAARAVAPGAAENATAAATPAEALAPALGDVNADGRLDILDALAVARSLRAGQLPPEVLARGDMTGDGTIDQADVDLIAHSAVSLVAIAVPSTPASPGGGS